MANPHHTINYIELPGPNLDAAKDFYGSVFGWSFINYGPDYLAFEGAGVDGGFDRTTPPYRGGALVVLYSDNLEKTMGAVVAAGGEIVRPIFTFPGGRRFHFVDPMGNELAVWANPE